MFTGLVALMRRVTVLGFAALVLSGAAKKNGPVDLNIADGDNHKVHLKDLRGKIVVVNFWATWCGPCNEEMPMLVEAEKVWAPKGVVFIGASLDGPETRKNIPEFVAKYRPAFSIWKGATLDDLKRLGLGQGVPDSLFVDADGTVFARVLGEMRKSELEERLVWATGDRAGAAPVDFLNHM